MNKTQTEIQLGADFGYQPENFGFRQIGDIEWRDESYEFDLTTVWQHKESGAFYMADDSGCSCPSPYEDVRSTADLIVIGRLQDLVDHLDARNAEVNGSCSADVATLVQAYRAAKDG